ncbi:spindle assembly abnormal protein 6 homolog [Caerostris extrusa]|uniref:Spindle assembly abnormal protein 6 homolog n=1 Tax=Caerostris extrusa TaxID=172846 RepID=A0AAV4XRP7_CAEEX|nr:spindle assembly abnormal protein 6 homolog [Caerostris extrusa]
MKLLINFSVKFSLAMRSEAEEFSSFKTRAKSQCLTNRFLRSFFSVIKYLNRQLTDRCILPQYIPPSNLMISPSQNSAGTQVVKATTSGGAGDATHSDKSKSIPSRRKIQGLSHISAEMVIILHLMEEIHNSPYHIPADSAYISAPTCTARDKNASPADTNVIAPNFEIDSAALSAAFGSEQILKHSTAKKSIGGRNKIALRKK